MIEIENVTIRILDKDILKNISLKIDSDITILGANGSGKSTFVKSLLGLNINDGIIKINNKDILSISIEDRAKLISYIPTKLEVYDSFISVEEFILLGRFTHKKVFADYSKKDKKIVDEVMRFLHITAFRNTYIHDLSSGEQQLVLIAQALVQESKIIIFDEPTANLDPKNSKIIANYIKELKNSHTIILITHDLHLAAFINSEILFLSSKSVKLYGNEFFSDDFLKRVYGVSFNSLAVEYV